MSELWLKDVWTVIYMMNKFSFQSFRCLLLWDGWNWHIDNNQWLINVRKALYNNIANKIVILRETEVILDRDLADMYQVENRVLKQAVKRNIERFPEEFMFELSANEVNWLVSQSVIPSKSYFGGALPFAFSEQGVAMLSAVLKSPAAVWAKPAPAYYKGNS